MKKAVLSVPVLIIILLIVGAWFFFGSPKVQAPSYMGSYAYECDEHVSFLMTPSSDLSTIDIKPQGGAYPPASTLKKQVTNSGARYEGNGVVFVAHGEGVVLGEGDSAINCSPTPSQTQAPFNFGD